MKLSSFTTILIFIVVIISGIAFLPTLPVKLNAKKAVPSIKVSYSWNGVNGRVIEQEVTSVLEASFSRMPGLTSISSTSSSGRGFITLNFDKNVNIDAARFEIATLIRQAYPRFPEQVSYPFISLNTPDDEKIKPFLTYTLNAQGAPADIQNYAEANIKPRLLNIKGIHTVDVFGAMPMEWIIEYDIEKLANLKISTGDIRSAIGHYLAAESVGLGLETSKTEKSVIHLVLQNHTYGDINLSKIPVKNTGGRIVYLEDIARLARKEQMPLTYFRINGANSVNIVITANESANQLLAARNVTSQLIEIEKTLPPGFFLIKGYDATEYIKTALNKNGQRMLFTIIFLFTFLLIISRKIKYLAVVVVSLIATISIAILCYKLFKTEIHLYTLAGITVSLGLIINNIVVMVDHVGRYKNKKVFLASLASTLAVTVALCTVFLMQGRLKEDLADFSTIIIINVLSSLFVALALVPALMEKIPLRIKQATKTRRGRFLQIISAKYPKYVQFSCRYRWLFILIFIAGFGVPLFLLPEKIQSESKWAEVYNKTLGNSWYTEKIKPYADKGLGGTLRLFLQNVFEKSFYSDAEKTTLMVNVQLPYGSTLDQMNSLVISAEKYLLQFKEIEQFQSQIVNPQNAQIIIYFTSKAEEEGFPYQLKELMTQKAIDLGGADWTIHGVGEGFSNAVSEFLGQYRISMYGYNYDELYRLASQVRKKLMINPRVKEVSILSRDRWTKDRSYEFVLTTNKETLMRQNANPLILTNNLNNYSLAENVIAYTTAGGALERIRLRSEQSSKMDLWQIQNYPGKAGSTFTKLIHNSEVRRENISLDICKENQQYRLILAYDYIGSNVLALRQQERVITEVSEQLPLGFKIKSSGGGRWYTENKKQFWLLLLIIIGIYFVCAVLLESLLLPLAIIFMIPVSYIGVFLTFYLFDLNFDQGGFASFILLSGISVGSALYIINDFCILKRKFARKFTSSTLYLLAFQNKIKPVTITLVSVILTMLPFISSKQEPFWTSMAAGIIGGLAFTFIAIVFFLPMAVLKKHKKAFK